jgi:hypothetical protein
MSATPGRGKAEARKAYAKPAVKRVHLKPEEAVLGGCKSATSYGPIASGCSISGAPCSTLAS